MNRSLIALLGLCSISLLCFGQFCERDKRITPENYLIKYYSIKRDIVKRIKADSALDVLDVLSTCTNEGCRSEICLHNRFLFTDFLLYFQLTDDYERYSRYEGSTYYHQLLRTRDSLYGAWLGALSFRMANNYCEWESDDLSNTTEAAFHSLGSKRFAWLETLTKPFNSKPSARKRARREIHAFLDARTPFSGVMSLEAIQFIQELEHRQSIQCLAESMMLNECDIDLYSMALLCANGNAKVALNMLGVLSAQRMYLIRDWKAWMEQNMTETEFNACFDALKQSSLVYFQIESRANRCGAGRNYPNLQEGQSDKSYHFYSTARLAFHLAELGFDEETTIRESCRPGNKYKRFIKLPGILHNIWLRNDLTAGTVGDYRSVTNEQRMGAEWGWTLHQAQ